MKKTNLLLALFAVASSLTITGCGSSSDSKVTTFEICDDTSNAVRAFELLEAKGVVTEADKATFYNDAKGEFAFNGKTWTNSAKTVEITLIAENLLVSSMADYDYACLPCNTAYTGNVSADKRVAVEDDPEQVAGKANIIAARKDDYANDASYKQKIDALANAMLSQETSDYFNQKYLGAMTCDSSTQIDLRSATAETIVNTGDKITINVCASDVPHAEVLNGVVKGILEAQGYTLNVSIIDWTTQNDCVSKGDYDANYFQHVPYLETYTGTPELFAVCKVHYEPLGIYSNSKTKTDFEALTK